jgi:SWI/SNF-related matrix-associated actin-dependent regulator 1 of chromatin subfamily A
VAPPARGCGRCLADRGDSNDRCEACPLSGGQYVLGGLERIRSVRTLKQWRELGVELVFELAARDFGGRHEDLLRVARTASGAALPPLAADLLARADDAALPEDATLLLDAALAAARPEIEARAAAVGAYLRLRGAAQFERRRDEILGTFAAMQAEPDVDRAAAARALRAEVERLQDVHGAEVTVRVASIVFVATTMVEVEVADRSRRTLRSTLDLGRGLVRSATWDGPGGCAAPPVATPLEPETGAEAPFTAAQLAALPAAILSDCLSWLLARGGARVDRATESGDDLHLRGERGGRAFEALAILAPGGPHLAARDVRRAATLGGGDREAAHLLISTVPAAEAARAEARRLEVEVWDRATLVTLLAAEVEAYARAEREKAAGAEARVASAAEVRTQLLAAIVALEGMLATSRPGERLRTQAEVARAVEATEQARGAARRALLALETLADDLRAVFAERPARDGSLAIVAPAGALEELRERGLHLVPVAAAAIAAIAEQAASGVFGYAAWRKAVVEELTARCESVRWRAVALDPAKWRAFDAALDAHAATQAELAAAAAERAATRAARQVPSAPSGALRST